MLLVIHQYMSITFNVYYNIVNVENWQALPPNVPPWRRCLDTSATGVQCCLVTSENPLSYKSASDEAFDISQCHYKDPSLL